jgi:predicted ATPase with chaperone activity
LFDPVIHEPLESLEETVRSDQLTNEAEVDRRWVLCRRPLVTVGGELTLESLDLAYSESARFYRAPVQLLANGGVLVVDDFGRQRVSPREMLNRWIVPLETRKDFLVLHTGQKFDVSLDLLIVFATNLKPSDLVDEAFLRRIRHKVFAESPTVDEFIQIFEQYCHRERVAFDRQLVEDLIAQELRRRGVALRGCQPRDLIDHALYLANYLDQPRALTRDLLSAACATYFLEEREVAQA